MNLRYKKIKSLKESSGKHNKQPIEDGNCLNEALYGMNQIEQFVKMADAIGLKTMNDFKDFMDREGQDKDVLTALYDYLHNEIGDLKFHAKDNALKEATSNELYFNNISDLETLYDIFDHILDVIQKNNRGALDNFYYYFNRYFKTHIHYYPDVKNYLDNLSEDEQIKFFREFDSEFTSLSYDYLPLSKKSNDIDYRNLFRYIDQEIPELFDRWDYFDVIFSVDASDVYPDDEDNDINFYKWIDTISRKSLEEAYGKVRLFIIDYISKHNIGFPFGHWGEILGALGIKYNEYIGVFDDYLTTHSSDKDDYYSVKINESLKEDYLDNIKNPDYWQHQVDYQFEKFGRVGGGLIQDLDENGFYLNADNKVTKKIHEDTIKDPKIKWTFIKSKEVEDSDGFLTDYTWYEGSDGTQVMVFGDNDIYKPEDGYFDITFTDRKQAEDWFNSY